MATYSHSRISLFEQCKYQYKLKYIDKVKVDIKTTIEAFCGDIVHQTLEKLYKDLNYHKLNTCEELLNFYSSLWDEKYTDDIRIVKKEYSAQNYKDRGAKFVCDYYKHYKPFEETRVLGLETQDMLDLSNSSKYHVRIDRLCSDNKGNYYVCDYKTNSRLKTQEEADGDRQLAMYALWVKDRFKDAKSVKLIWYMLAFDREVLSERTEKELDELKKDVERKIETIENCRNFPTSESNLCTWCVYSHLCPLFSHKADLEDKKGLKKYMAQDGLVLTDSLADMLTQKKEIERKIDEVKENLIEFAKQSNADVIYGTDKKAAVKEYEKVVYPSDKEKFIDTLKQKGLYEEFSGINYLKLGSRILKKEIDKDIIEMTKLEKNYRISISKNKNYAHKRKRK